jgi:hypothetical protein
VCKEFFFVEQTITACQSACTHVFFFHSCFLENSSQLSQRTVWLGQFLCQISNRQACWIFV